MRLLCYRKEIFCFLLQCFFVAVFLGPTTQVAAKSLHDSRNTIHLRFTQAQAEGFKMLT